MAQQNATVTGLPEHGLVLSGTIAEPVLENLTGQRILAWALRWVLARPNISAPLSYVCVFNSQLLSKTGADRAALAPGSSRAHRYEQGTRDIAQGEAPVSVSLDLAMLDDGSVVGPDLGQSYDRIEAAAKALRDVNAKVISDKDAGVSPDQIFGDLTALATQPRPSGSLKDAAVLYRIMAQTYARDLLAERTQHGDAGAFALAMDNQTVVQPRRKSETRTAFPA
ncbi:MAG TPA: hypothetical protein VKX45_24150 [Bryobacteraceae bacterium]|jgi:hypothetical protein|nr:hypothetical protein [Bryobacteraceae bacterium]